MPSGLPTSLAAAAGTSKKQAELVWLASNGNTISRMMRESAKAGVATISMELEACAKTYVACPNTDDEAFDEIIEFVAAKFGGLNVSEIREAFRLVAAKEIGVDLKAWYGQFTVMMMGEVLTAYMDWRERLQRLVLEQMAQEREAKRAAARAANHDSSDWEARRAEWLLKKTAPTVEMVTAYDFEWLQRAGQIELTREERWDMFEKAFEPTIEQLLAENATSGPFKKIEVNKQITAARMGEPDAGFCARQRAMAQRLAVVNWIIQTQNQNNDGTEN